MERKVEHQVSNQLQIDRLKNITEKSIFFALTTSFCNSNHILVGLGGTGGKILRAFKMRMFEEFHDDEIRKDTGRWSKNGNILTVTIDEVLSVPSVMTITNATLR